MTSIPVHPITDCRNVHSRLQVLDDLLASGIFHGGVHAARKRIEVLENGAHLAKEFDFYVSGAACCTCFWKLLAKVALKDTVANPSPTASIQYMEIVGKREDIESDACMRRFTKQKTTPITQIAWVLEDLDEHDEFGNDCIVKICCKTDNDIRIRKQALERAFPEGALVDIKHATTGLVLTVLEDRTSTKEGKWDQWEHV